jgi:hypothetical protein
VASTTRCRSCSAVVSTRHQCMFAHLVGCVGIASVVDDAAETLHRALASSCPSSVSVATSTTSAAESTIGLPRTAPDPDPDPDFSASVAEERHFDGASSDPRVESSLDDSGTTTEPFCNEPDAEPAHGAPVGPPGQWTNKCNIEEQLDESGSDPTSIDPSSVVAATAASAACLRGSRWTVLDSNQRFVAANFDRTPDGGPPSMRCRICDKLVMSKRYQSSHSLRHAISLSCLVRRVVVGQCNNRLEAPAAAAPLPPYCTLEALADACESTLVKGVFKSYWGCHFFAPFESPQKKLCRHCNSQVLGGGFKKSFGHLIGCIGIVPMLEVLGGILRTTLSPGFFTDLRTRRNGSTATGVPPPLRLPPESPSRGSGERMISQKEHVIEPRIDVLTEAVDAAPMTGDQPSAGRRTRDAIHEQNLAFLASTFVPTAGSRTGCACVFCDQDFPGCGVSDLLRHVISRSCLSRRVERALLLPCDAPARAPAAAAAPSLARSSSSSSDGGGHDPARSGLIITRLRRIPAACAGLPQNARATAALQEYRGRHFARAASADPPSLHLLWACRRCGAQGRGFGHQPFLGHLIQQCAGVVVVVRDLEDILTAIVRGLVEP